MYSYLVVGLYIAELLPFSTYENKCLNLNEPYSLNVFVQTSHSFSVTQRRATQNVYKI